ncbi:MAG TPA: hypothetical protein VNT76_24270 [Candidatus Binatus sp.]|nr:hypothetical protein [Candidatus Binatus sp.]
MKHVKPRTTPPRPGPSARNGNGRGLMPTVYVKNVRVKRLKNDVAPETRTIAQLWGNEAPEGDMTVMRQKRREKILKRQAQSMKDKKAYLQRRLKEKAA